MKFLQECQQRATTTAPSIAGGGDTAAESGVAAAADSFHHRLHITQVQQWKIELERKIHQQRNNNNLDQATSSSSLHSISTSFRGYTMAQNLAGIWDIDHTILKLLNQGIQNMNEVDGEWFWYRDFNFYYTVS